MAENLPQPAEAYVAVHAKAQIEVSAIAPKPAAEDGASGEGGGAAANGDGGGSAGVRPSEIIILVEGHRYRVDLTSEENLGALTPGATPGDLVNLRGTEIDENGNALGSVTLGIDRNRLTDLRADLSASQQLAMAAQLDPQEQQQEIVAQAMPRDRQPGSFNTGPSFIELVSGEVKNKDGTISEITDEKGNTRPELYSDRMKLTGFDDAGKDAPERKSGGLLGMLAAGGIGGGGMTSYSLAPSPAAPAAGPSFQGMPPSVLGAAVAAVGNIGGKLSFAEAPLAGVGQFSTVANMDLTGKEAERNAAFNKATGLPGGANA